MTTVHTPGPWHTKRDGFSAVYVEARIGGGWVQEVAACGPTEKGSEQQEANARLIAAAPELLEALQDCLGQIAAGPDGQRVYFAAKKVIAKATGSQP